jgi:hypothetical protein
MPDDVAGVEHERWSDLLHQLEAASVGVTHRFSVGTATTRRRHREAFIAGLARARELLFGSGMQR